MDRVHRRHADADSPTDRGVGPGATGATGAPPARPSGGSSTPHRPRRRTRFLAVAALSAIFVAIPLSSAAGATTVTSQWGAPVGSNGANGAATIKILSTKAGSIALSLKGLARATTYSAAIHTGTCARPSTAKLLALVNIRSTSTGTFARTSSLTAAQAAKVNRTGTVIRFVAGTRIVCGTFKAVVLPPPPPAIAATIKIGRDPTGVAVTPQGVFAANWFDGTLSRVDPATNTVLSTLSLDIQGIAGPQGLAYGEGALWVVTWAIAFDDTGLNVIPGAVYRVDLATGQTVATIPVGRGSTEIATSPGAVWVSNYSDDTVTRIDPATNQVVTAVTVGDGPVGVAFGFGSLWVANENSATLSRIDPATNQVVTTVPTVASPGAVVIGAGSVWVTNSGRAGQPDGVLSRIDPLKNMVVRTIPVGVNPVSLAFAGGSVWVAMQGEPSVVRVNPTTNAVQHRVSVTPPEIGADGRVVTFRGIAATDHAVWVTKPRPAAAADAPTPDGDLVRINY